MQKMKVIYLLTPPSLQVEVGMYIPLTGVNHHAPVLR